MSRRGDPSHTSAVARLAAARNEEGRLAADAHAAKCGSDEREVASRLNAATAEVAAREAWVGWVERGVQPRGPVRSASGWSTSASSVCPPALRPLQGQGLGQNASRAPRACVLNANVRAPTLIFASPKWRRNVLLLTHHGPDQIEFTLKVARGTRRIGAGSQQCGQRSAHRSAQRQRQTLPPHRRSSTLAAAGRPNRISGASRVRLVAGPVDDPARETERCRRARRMG
jgi:hypothetical protein